MVHKIVIQENGKLWKHNRSTIMLELDAFYTIAPKESGDSHERDKLLN